MLQYSIHYHSDLSHIKYPFDKCNLSSVGQQLTARRQDAQQQEGNLCIAL